MKNVIFLTTLLLCFSNGYSQSTVSRNYRDFIPAGLDTLGVFHGDFNGDHHDDIALVCHVINEEWDAVDARPLIVLLWTPNGYRCIARNDSVILCKGCGGMMGDPFVGIEIKKSVLTISHFGGTAWKWKYVRKFKWIKNNLFLVGKTDRSYWNVEWCNRYHDKAATDLEDINLITGKRYRKKISQECKLLLDEWDRVKIEPLISLSDYTMNE